MLFWVIKKLNFASESCDILGTDSDAFHVGIALVNRVHALASSEFHHLSASIKAEFELLI